jgi:hypothetical protein
MLRASDATPTLTASASMRQPGAAWRPYRGPRIPDPKLIRTWVKLKISGWKLRQGEGLGKMKRRRERILARLARLLLSPDFYRGFAEEQFLVIIVCFPKAPGSARRGIGEG